jgi:hypothetical protein
MKVLTLLLSSISEGAYSFKRINKIEFLKSQSSYGYTKRYRFGRLFSAHVSINQLSEEFRCYLFSDVYNNISICNSHPTILLEFAQEHHLSTPFLHSLVKESDEFYDVIKSHYGTDINAKELVLMSLNIPHMMFRSRHLNNLAKDLTLVRRVLKEKIYDLDLDFQAAVDGRCHKSITANAKALKMQSLYCFNKETDSIFSFIDFHKTQTPLEIKEMSSFVPFFDGVYVYTEPLFNFNTLSMQNEMMSVDLENIVEKYNDIHNIQFVQKTIKYPSKLISTESFNTIEHAIKIIDKMSHNQIISEFEALKVFDSKFSPITSLQEEKSRKVNFTYDQTIQIQNVHKEIYNKLINRVIQENNLNLLT